ncbi:MAG: UDP-N-acetylmuramate dehydrogenase [Gemmiger sp.]|nr:UDP-N-acetylmuramate dehydrogenase [Gemmiger sp.]
MAALAQALQAAGLPCRRGEPLARHTSFRIGGAAAVFCTPETLPELLKTLSLCREYGVRHYVLGNGSNTLFADAGFDGAVISTLRLQNRRVLVDGQLVQAGAGIILSTVCQEAQKNGLSGLEFAYGIPGTVGGAVYMNAGAYGGEMKNALARVTFLDHALRLCTLDVAELGLGYRTSLFEQQERAGCPCCILEAEFALQKGDPAAIDATMQDLMARRREKQPLEKPSAGSTFKRPAGAFAGKLIEDCGLRGFAVGGAQISTKHCGFVVNTGNATCADVLQLTAEVRRIVQEKTGFTLEREIRVVE